MVSFNVSPLVTPTMIYVFSYVDILAHSFWWRVFGALEATADKDNKEASVNDTDDDAEDVKALDQSEGASAPCLKPIRVNGCSWTLREHCDEFGEAESDVNFPTNWSGFLAVGIWSW